MDRDRMESEGWKLASTTSGEHLRRTLEMYHELGFEVHTERVNPEECGECTECYEIGGEDIYRVYTRRKERAGDVI